MMLGKRLTELEANRGIKRYWYKMNKRAMLAKFKLCFVSLFKGDKLEEQLEILITNVAKESVPVRDGRKYERGKRNKVKKKVSSTNMPVV